MTFMNQGPFIKICGITRLEDAKFAISAGADAIGFIAYPKSPRFITAKAVKTICNALKADKTKKVGVFVNSSPATINEYIDAGIDIIQLHGDEDARFTQNFSDIEIWKAIKPQFNLDILRFIEFPAQKFLLDAFHESLPGGTGKTVDLELAKFAIDNLPAPVILAGGISPANFAEIFNAVQPFGMDINSGVEVSPGIKDHLLIKKIFEILRNA